MSNLVKKMRVWYSCSGCGIDRRPVDVRFRSDEEDVAFYVREVMGWKIGADHAATSPLCTKTTMDDVIMGMPKDARFIGDPLADYGDQSQPPDRSKFKKDGE